MKEEVSELESVSAEIRALEPSQDFTPHDHGLERDPSVLNRTEAALISRGVDNKLAASLRKAGWTIGKLKQQDHVQLQTLGFSSEAIRAIRAGRRPEIPFEHLIRALVASRFTCCVCHDPKKAIVVHHIRDWSESHDHSPANLAVLCLDHHDKAHSVSKLSRNLDDRTLLRLKHEWEGEVCRTNTEAVLEASRLKSDAWWYFNHVRLFEIAAHLKLQLRKLPYFRAVFGSGLVHPDGSFRPRASELDYMYSGSEGTALYCYVREVMNAVLERSTVFNISDNLERGLLAPVLKSGDIVFVQGAHRFSAVGHHRSGRNQTYRGVRRANRVKVSFTFDRWEATSNSAWFCWLSGRQEAGSLVRIVSVQKVDGNLQIDGTVLGICSPLEGLKEREYAALPYRRGIIINLDQDDEQEEECDDDLDSEFQHLEDCAAESGH